MRTGKRLTEIIGARPFQYALLQQLAGSSCRRMASYCGPQTKEGRR
jgi:hypothetical protein